MPIYTYWCEKCQGNKTKIAKIAERDIQACPECKTEMKRKVDAPGSVWSPTRNNGYS